MVWGRERRLKVLPGVLSWTTRKGLINCGGAAAGGAGLWGEGQIRGMIWVNEHPSVELGR